MKVDTKHVLWVLKQMKSTIENLETGKSYALIHVIQALDSAIKHFEQAIIDAEATHDETTT